MCISIVNGGNSGGGGGSNSNSNSGGGGGSNSNSNSNGNSGGGGVGSSNSNSIHIFCMCLKVSGRDVDGGLGSLFIFHSTYITQIGRTFIPFSYYYVLLFVFCSYIYFCLGCHLRFAEKKRTVYLVN